DKGARLIFLNRKMYLASYSSAVFLSRPRARRSRCRCSGHCQKPGHAGTSLLELQTYDVRRLGTEPILQRPGTAVAHDDEAIARTLASGLDTFGTDYLERIPGDAFRVFVLAVGRQRRGKPWLQRKRCPQQREQPAVVIEGRRRGDPPRCRLPGDARFDLNRARVEGDVHRRIVLAG